MGSFFVVVKRQVCFSNKQLHPSHTQLVLIQQQPYQLHRQGQHQLELRKFHQKQLRKRLLPQLLD